MILRELLSCEIVSKRTFEAAIMVAWGVEVFATCCEIADLPKLPKFLGLLPYEVLGFEEPIPAGLNVVFIDYGCLSSLCMAAMAGNHVID